MHKKTNYVRKKINDYIKVLEANGINVEQVILYGSYARGDFHKYSDIDLVIISHDLKRWPPVDRLELLARLTAKIHAPLEVIGYTPNEIKKNGKDSIFWEEIEREGKMLYAA